MIVSGGFNVYPREVEDALSWHPAVHAVAVIGVPDEKWGEAVKAIVVKREGCTTTEQELIAFTREKKGPVAAPKSIDFVQELPLTSLGKPDKKILRAQFWDIHERQLTSHRSNSCQPRTNTTLSRPGSTPRRKIPRL